MPDVASAVDWPAGAPAPAVLDAFGAPPAPPVRLAGGQGTSWWAGPLVLKPVDGVMGVELLDHLAPVLLDVARAGPAGFRLPEPVRSRGGGWCVRGWSAARWTPGRAVPSGRPVPTGRWYEVLDAGAALHDALAHVPRPDVLDQRRDPWAVADRVAWGEDDLVVGPWAADLVARLRALCEPTGGPCQLVHGDLSGNTLLHPGSAPAIIDLSPYWRPAAWAGAVVVADALLWHAAGADLLATAGDAGDPSLVARALLFRLLVEEQAARGGPVPLADTTEDHLAPYRRAMGLVERAG